MLQEMKIQLEYLNMPVYEMLYRMKSNEYFSKLKFLGECCTLVEAGYDFPKAWKRALENNPLYYMKEEKEKLLHLGTILGTSDQSNQIDIISIHSQHFEAFLKNAKITQQKYGNMSLIISALIGCMIFIIVI